MINPPPDPIAQLDVDSELQTPLTPLQITLYNLRANKSAITGFVGILFLLLLIPLAPLFGTHDPQQDLSRLPGYGRNIGGNPPCIPFLNNLGCKELPNQLDTLHSNQIDVALDADGTVILNNGQARIIDGDLAAVSNIIHVIDGVLISSPDHPADINVTSFGLLPSIPLNPLTDGEHGDFSILLDAFEVTNFEEWLVSSVPFTLFAPTDTTFQQYFAHQGIDQATFFADTDAVKELLAYHVINGRRRDTKFFQQIGNSTHNFNFMGIDRNSRDVYSRVIYGVRRSLPVGLAAVTIAIICGSLIGLVSGYLGGWWDNSIMRFMDVLIAFPSLLLAITIVTILGPGLFNALIAIAIVSIPQYARLIRASVLSVKEYEFVTAARTLGADPMRLIFLHILPNAVTSVIVQGTLGIGTAILDAAALSFLGLGAQPPIPEWGLMLSEARGDFRAFPHLMFFPGIAIMITVLAFNLLGDGIRDVLDPKLNKR